MSFNNDLAYIAESFERVGGIPARGSQVQPSAGPRDGTLEGRKYVHIRSAGQEERFELTENALSQSSLAEVTSFVQDVISKKQGHVDVKLKILNSFNGVADTYKKDYQQDRWVRIVNFFFGENSSWHTFFNTKVGDVLRCKNIIENERVLLERGGLKIRADLQQFLNGLSKELQEDFDAMYRTLDSDKQDVPLDEVLRNVMAVKAYPFGTGRKEDIGRGVTVNNENGDWEKRMTQLRAALEAHLVKMRGSR